MLKNLSAVFSRKILLVAGVVLVAGGITVGLFLYSQSNNNGDSSSNLTEQDVTDKDLAESLATNNQTVQSYTEELNKTTTSYLTSIQSVEDLKKLDANEQGRVGVIIINDRINSDKIQEAQQFIDYVMNLPTGYGLEAARLCYVTADAAERKKQCEIVVTTRAVEQGVISAGEALPPSYFEIPTGDPS